MEVEQKQLKQETRETDSKQERKDSSLDLVLKGVTFSPASAARTSKVYQFFRVSESTEQVACVTCHKILKGINSSNCISHLNVHDSVFYPEIDKFLQSLKSKHDEKQEAEEKYRQVLRVFLQLPPHFSVYTCNNYLIAGAISIASLWRPCSERGCTKRELVSIFSKITALQETCFEIDPVSHSRQAASLRC